MIIQLNNDRQIDTATDLSPEERHILQKLLCYKVICGSIEELREKTAKALHAGWNDSGPVKKSDTMALLIGQIEKEMQERLQEKEL